MTRPRKKSNLVAARARMYHELIFDCAERLFAEEGFAESTMQDLAAEAGISLKTLYAAFPGKDEIYREIVVTRGRGLVEVVATAATGEGTALERLREGLRRIIAYLIEHKAFFRILLQEGRAWGLDPRGEGARDAWRAGHDSVRNVLEDGISSGEFLEGDPDLLAATVNAVLQVQLAALLDRSKDPDPEEISDKILVTLRRMLCGADAPAGRTRPAA